MFLALEGLVRRVSMDIEDSDSNKLRYGAIEFNQSEVDFLRNYLDLESKRFMFSVEQLDIEAIMKQIGDNLRKMNMGECMGDIAHDHSVENAIREYFLKKQFI